MNALNIFFDAKLLFQAYFVCVGKTETQTSLPQCELVRESNTQTLCSIEKNQRLSVVVHFSVAFVFTCILKIYIFRIQFGVNITFYNSHRRANAVVTPLLNHFASSRITFFSTRVCLTNSTECFMLLSLWSIDVGILWCHFHLLHLDDPRDTLPAAQAAASVIFTLLAASEIFSGTRWQVASGIAIRFSCIVMSHVVENSKMSASFLMAHNELFHISRNTSRSCIFCGRHSFNLALKACRC